MEPFCPRSQQLLPAADAPCESCGAVTKDATAMVRGVGAITPVGRVGVVGESRFDDGREVIQYRAPSGAASDAVLDQGNVQLRISPPVDIGRPGEARVRQGMLAALRAEGREVSSGPAIDSAGEDFALSCDGRALAVQVVTVPSAPAFWQSVSQGSGQTNVSIAQAAD
jgi:hypothetical protein